jgi:alpha-beta hydrolase superfamily lysophospholipase
VCVAHYKKIRFFRFIRFDSFVVSFHLHFFAARWASSASVLQHKDTRITQRQQQQQATMTAITPEDSTIDINGAEICLHTWNASLESPKAVVLIFHGFAAHGLYPTVRYAAQLLATSDYLVVAPDLPGHGASGGIRGYIPSAASLLDAGGDIANHVQEQYLNKTTSKKLFLLGSSMGGAISLGVAQKLLNQVKDNTTPPLAGVVLLAPMLMLSVGSAARSLLAGLAMLPVINTLPIIPSSSTSLGKQYRDPEKCKECEDDTLSISGNLRVASASACVEMAAYVQSQFENVQVPFLLLVADEDVVVQNQGSLNLMEHAPSKDKKILRYPALHGLLCEPQPLCNDIQNDIIQWINARV